MINYKNGGVTTDRVTSNTTAAYHFHLKSDLKVRWKNKKIYIYSSYLSCPAIFHICNFIRFPSEVSNRNVI